MISLYLDDGTAYVWNAEDWYELRTKHRICGSLIGSAPSYPRQNDYPGLPLALMSEEAALLLDRGICELYSLPDLISSPTEDCKNSVKQLEERLLEEQTEALKKRKIEQMSQKIDIIIAGKKKKMIAKGLPDDTLDKQALIQEEINKLPPLAPAHVLVHLPTEHSLETKRQKCTVKDLKPSVLEGDAAKKYAIFKDLWEQDHYITDGLKFGCDYLVYPGDPVRFHAMFMVRFISDSTASFQASSLVAFGRLSVSVNKLAVLATVDASNEVSYQTLQWHESVNG